MVTKKKRKIMYVTDRNMKKRDRFVNVYFYLYQICKKKVW